MTTAASIARLVPVLSLAAWLGAVPIAASDGVDFERLLEEKRGSVVTIKAVLKSEVRAMGQSRDEESRVEVPGVVVDPSGLVLASNMPFSAERLMRLMGGAGAMFEITITPVDIKVRVEGDDEERSAFVVATDSDLDLIFLQIEDPGDRELVAVSFDDAGSIRVGQELLALSRLGEGYDYAPFVASGRVTGQVRRPRRAWIVEGNVTGLGLPVFSRGGQVLGVLTTIPVATEADAGRGPFGGMMQMFEGGGTGPFGTFLVPARTVTGLVAAARERAAELEAERALEAPER